MQISTIVVIGIVILFLILFIIFFITGTSQKGLEKKLTKMGNIAARAQNNIINNNEDILKETANKTANIHKDAVKTVVHSVKEGLTEDSSIYCKYCGSNVDGDSTFYKNCGKKLQ